MRSSVFALLFILLPMPGIAEPAPFFVELQDEPAVEVWTRHRDPQTAQRVTRNYLDRLESQQRTLEAALNQKTPGVRVIHRLQRVLNGFVILAEADQAAAVARLPGVARVRSMVPKKATNSSSVPFLGTPELWDATGLGLTGEGQRIGIIDTGIDYLHTDFGGSGLAGDYGANHPGTLGDVLFPSLKVVGGFDFVGDAYDAGDPAHAMPMPDPDPMDCNGHGTHVAGTVAGFGVRGDGTTYDGAYDPTIDFETLAIGPGVAPEATLYALKVFGCQGETTAVESALEWAVDPNGDGDFSDRLDVVNLSLTNPFGAGDDPTAEAAERATAAGVAVVASAGNDGAQHFIVGSPATADSAVAVAASWDPDDTFLARAVRITLPTLIAGTHQAGGANFGPPLTEGITGLAAEAEPADACSPLTNGPEITGKVALIDRSADCTYVTQVRHAQLAGALAVVLMNNREGLEGVFNDGTGGDITIPPLLIRQAVGEAIRSQLPGTVELTLTPTVLEDQFAAFSSRGPRRGAETALKPDLAAPGVAITSAGLGNAGTGGTGAMILSGTSMASPHVAGAIALLRQLRPDWTPAELKAVLMNTAGDVYFDPEGTPPVLTPAHMGAGRLRPTAAAENEVTAVDAEYPARVSLSFGTVQATEDTVRERRLRFDNRTAAEVAYTLEVRTLSDLPGATLEFVDGPEIVVPAGSSAEKVLRLTVTRDDLRHDHDPTLEESTFGFARHWLSEEAGHVIAQPVPTDGPGATLPLRTPFHVAVRPASATAGPAALDLGSALVTSTELVLSGPGVDTGDPEPHGIRSRLSAFELQLLGQGDPEEPLALGVTTDLPAHPDGFAGAHLYFGLVAAEPWSTPHTVRLEVSIDTDRDGAADFRLSNSDDGSEDFDFPTDAFVTVLENLTNGTRSVESPLNALSPAIASTAPFSSHVALLPVALASLGLGPGHGPIHYTARVLQSEDNGSIARPQRGVNAWAGPASYDVEQPGITFTGGVPGAPLFFDQDGATVPVEVDLAAFDARDSLGILLFHHHGASPHWEIVPLTGERPDLALTLDALDDPIAPGALLTYQVTVRNLGLQPAPQSTVLLHPPTDTTFENGTIPSECMTQGDELSCNLDTLAPGQVRVLSILVRLGPGILHGARLTAHAEASTSAIDPNPLNDRAERSVDVREAGWLFGDGFESGDLSAWSF